jgi:hypothetical protein
LEIFDRPAQIVLNIARNFERAIDTGLNHIYKIKIIFIILNKTIFGMNPAPAVASF